MKDFVNIRDSYKSYKKLTNKAIDKVTYCKILAMYNKFLINQVLEGELVTLPAGLGTLSIMGKKQKVSFDEEGRIKGLGISWNKTKELWKKDPLSKEKKKVVYCTNDHTGGIRYKYVWSKKRVLVTYKTLYSLRMMRVNKRAVHKKLMEGKEYINRN